MEYVRTLTREFEVGERAELRVDNRSGIVEVRGADTRQVRVEAVAHLWADDEDEADEQAEQIVEGMQQEAERVAIRAPALVWHGPFFFGRGPRIDYVVTAPRATSAQITSRSGRVEVADVDGRLDVEAWSGRVLVSRIGDDTTISARSGSVQVEAIAGSLTVESKSGGIRVRRCKGDVKVQSRSGSLRVENVGGSLLIDSRSGSQRISEVGGALTVRSRTGSLRYEGAVRGPFDIDVKSGTVLLAVDPDSFFFLDAETTHGSVRSDLPLRRTPAIDSPSREAGPTVRIRTRSGSVRVEPR